MKLALHPLSLDSVAALPERERRLALGGLALAAAILVFGVVIPLDRSVAHAHERLARKRADLTWMQGVALELAASAPPPASTGESLLVIIDRKSTRLNSSHSQISYAVFCLTKKSYELVGEVAPAADDRAGLGCCPSHVERNGLCYREMVDEIS